MVDAGRVQLQELLSRNLPIDRKMLADRDAQHLPGLACFTQLARGTLAA